MKTSNEKFIKYAELKKEIDRLKRALEDVEMHDKDLFMLKNIVANLEGKLWAINNYKLN